MAAVLFSVYADVPDVLANLSNFAVETASLVGMNATLTTGISAATTGSVQVSATSPASGTITAYILDGGQSEVVTATVVDSTHISISSSTPTLAAHSAGVCVTTAGVSGNLADMIRRQSAQVENLCRQGADGSAAANARSLFRQQWVNETLSGPNSSRASVGADQTLNLRPYHFPIASVASASIQIGAASAISLSTTYLTIPDGARTLAIPSPYVLPSDGTPVLYNYLPRAMPFWVSLTYTAGPCGDLTLASVPADIRDALYYLIMDTLSYRANPYGSVEMRRGDTMFRHAAGVRGDVGAEGMFLSRAKVLLKPYTNVTW